MRHFELSDDQVQVLHEILEHHLSELRMEIANTDDRDYRRYLRGRIEFLEGFVPRLAGEASPEPELAGVQGFAPGRTPENLDSLLE